RRAARGPGVGILAMRRLSVAAVAGIRGSMKGAVVLAVALAAAGCGIRPLTSAELYGAAGSGGGGGTGGSAPGGAGGGGSGGTSAGGTGGGGTAGTEAGADGGGSDGDASGCAQPCPADQFCDELTDRCAPSSGSGMLSGSVTDACSGGGI